MCDGAGVLKLNVSIYCMWWARCSLTSENRVQIKNGHWLFKKRENKVQVSKRGRERSDTRGGDFSARNSIHSTTLRSVCLANRLVRQEMSRTPSCTMLPGICLPHGTACTDFNCAGETRAMYRKPLLSQVLEIKGENKI